MDLRVATQPVKNRCQRSSFGKALEITLGLYQLLRPPRQSNLFAVIFEGHVLRCAEVFPGFVFGSSGSALVMYALGDIDEFGQRRLKGRRNEKLDLLGRITRELLCEPIKDLGVVQALLRKRLNDGEGSPDQSLGFVAAKLRLQCSPLIDSVERIGQIEGWVHQKIPVDADLP